MAGYSQSTLAVVAELAAKKKFKALLNDIEDALAGLRINGIQPHQIEIQHHPDDVRISVDGVVRYKFKHFDRL